MVLLSYAMSTNGKHIAYREGAYMFAVNNEFMHPIRVDLLDKISDGFKEERNGFVNANGNLDFMMVLLHIFMTEGLDGEAKGYRACRICPSMSTSLRYFPPLYSSHHIEGKHICKYQRSDEKELQSKNTLSGCLGSAEATGKTSADIFDKWGWNSLLVLYSNCTIP